MGKKHFLERNNQIFGGNLFYEKYNKPQLQTTTGSNYKKSQNAQLTTKGTPLNNDKSSFKITKNQDFSLSRESDNQFKIENTSSFESINNEQEKELDSSSEFLSIPQDKNEHNSGLINDYSLEELNSSSEFLPMNGNNKSFSNDLSTKSSSTNVSDQKRILTNESKLKRKEIAESLYIKFNKTGIKNNNNQKRNSIKESFQFIPKNKPTWNTDHTKDIISVFEQKDKKANYANEIKQVNTAVLNVLDKVNKIDSSNKLEQKTTNDKIIKRSNLINEKHVNRLNSLSLPNSQPPISGVIAKRRELAKHFNIKNINLNIKNLKTMNSQKKLDKGN